jgi:thiosulfate reductase cytochrome b subunit
VARIREKHPLWLRSCHWLNVPALALMVWSGLLIYWANDEYPGFFPQWFYKSLGIESRLAEGMAIHFNIGWVLVVNGAVYVALVFLSGHWRELFPNRQAIKDLPGAVLHDLGLRKDAPAQGKFNAAQRVAYTGVVFLAVVEVASGFAIYKPVQLGWLAALFGGYKGARLVHFIGMISFCLFFAMHLVQVMRAGWNNFRAMVAGFELEEDED